MNLNLTTYRLFSLIAMVAAPLAGMAQIALYGITTSNVGGTDNYGGIFRYVPQTNTFTSEHVCNATDGDQISGMVQVGDLFYGTTTTEGATGYGTVFRFDPLSGTYTKLADFDSINGKSPVDDMVPAPDGKLYGVTMYGGTQNGGTLFSFDPADNTITKLVDFLPGQYSQPMAGMIMGSNGHLYGMVSFYYGGLFEYDIATDNFQYIFDFPTTNAGRVPWGQLVEVEDSVFYGSTRYGGTGNTQEGTLFRYDQREDSFTTIKFYQGGADGAWPQNGMVHVGDNLYGFTYKGGVDTYGTFFKYDLVQGVYTKLEDLDAALGAYPENRPILGSDGKIYGHTKSGGQFIGRGNLIKYDIATSTFTNMYTITGGSGTAPINAMIEQCITPAPTGTANVTLCQGATVADLDANGTQIKWYASETSTTQLSVGTALTSGTYYATQTVQCPSAERLAVNVTLQSPPDVGVTLANQTITVNQSGALYQWINCGTNANVPGATQQSFTATANGQYKVRVTLGPCVATSSCTTIDDVGINDLDMGTVTIYPNPTRSDITIGSTARLAHIELMDNTGRVIISQPTSTQRTVLPLEHLAPGSYLLRLTDVDGRTGHSSVVKE